MTTLRCNARLGCASNQNQFGASNRNQSNLLPPKSPIVEHIQSEIANQTNETIANSRDWEGLATPSNFSPINVDDYRSKIVCDSMM
jgi:hypothetical protein